MANNFSRRTARPIGQVIDDMFARTGLLPQYRRASVAAVWPGVVGPHIAAYTTAAIVREHILHVYLSSAPLKEELGFLRQTLTAKINEAVGAKVINDIAIH